MRIKSFVNLVVLGLLLTGCQAIGWSEKDYYTASTYDASPVPMPPSLPTFTKIIQIVFSDGVTPMPGWCDDVATGRYWDDHRQPYIDAVRSWLHPFDISVTDSPVNNPILYVMVSAGGSEQCPRVGPGKLGLAPVGAPGSVANVWSDGLSFLKDGVVTAHEIGHALGGLIHNAETVGHIMDGPNCVECTEYENVDLLNESGAYQNAFQAMLTALGPRQYE